MSNAVKIALAVLKDQFIGRNPHDEDYEGFPIEQKIFLDHLSSDMDGIFESEKSWYAFCNGNFERACNGEGFWLEGDLKPSAINKWTCADTRKRVLNNLYTKFNSKLWVEVEPDQVDLKYTYELSGCDRNGYPTSVELIVTATLKASE